MFTCTCHLSPKFSSFFFLQYLLIFYFYHFSERLWSWWWCNVLTEHKEFSWGHPTEWASFPPPLSFPWRQFACIVGKLMDRHEIAPPVQRGWAQLSLHSLNCVIIRTQSYTFVFCLLRTANLGIVYATHSSSHSHLEAHFNNFNN